MWPEASEGLPVLAVVLVYVGVLLVLARRADRRQSSPDRGARRAVGYALSLGALCTSWIYFGDVGLAITTGWNFLPNLIGPIIGFVVLWPIWRRIAIVAKRENSSSVADFIAARYGKSRPLGALVASVAIIGALPYIALQILALSKAIMVIAGGVEPARLTIPLIVAALAGAAILFGARRPTITEHDRGLAQVVAADAVVKLGALLAVAVLAIWLMVREPGPLALGRLAGPPAIDAGFAIATMLCMVTTFCLPRMFHLGIVALRDVHDLRIGRWLFPTYLTAWAIAIVPIAIMGASGRFGDPYTVVLGLPLRAGGRLFTAAAFLGGFSAAAAMVTVEAIALSAMISNELILPWLARRHWTDRLGPDVGSTIVRVRQGAIVAILALAYAYFRATPSAANLPRMGFASLAASAQLVPALFGAVLWRRGHANGAFWGIVAGMAVWLLLVALPQLGWPDAAFAGPREPLLFNLGVVLSLSCNLVVYVTASLRSGERLIDRIQADAFVANAPLASSRGDRPLRGTVGELRGLLERFLGAEEAARGLDMLGREQNGTLRDEAPVTPTIARIAERMLAGAIGASSARSVVALALSEGEHDALQVRHILDEAAHAVLFSRDILHTALNGIDQGISVVDRDLRLVAWNQRYLDLFGYPTADIHVGRPLEEVIALNARHRDLSQREQAAVIEERLGPIRRREPQTYERTWPNGLVVRVVGRPLAGGEYVTSFSDVSEIRAAESATARMNEELEERVQVRTRELIDTNGALVSANTALAEAKALAERVVSAQQRFVAAASHDLLQPLHAARLYLGSAADPGTDADRQRRLVTRADLSIEAADRLLKALLNLSRIEVGGFAPERSPVDLGGMFAALGREFAPMAAAGGIGLRFAPTRAWGLTNPDLIRSVLQNLVGNAIRYTPQGCVFVGVRAAGGALRIEVRDSGPGITHEARELIFREFTRLPETSQGTSGMGLGLSIAQRICTALDHRLAVRSEPGRGSVFSVTLPPADAVPPAAGPARAGRSLEGARILCLDDQPEVLRAQAELLEHWGAAVTGVQSADEALATAGRFAVAIADLHLGGATDGLDVLEAFRPRADCRLLLTANISDEQLHRAEGLGVAVLRKPIGPGALRAFLAEAVRVSS